MTTHDGATSIYSGRPQDENMSRDNVDILVDKEAKRSLIEWHPVSARIIVACFKTTIRNIRVLGEQATTRIPLKAHRKGGTVPNGHYQHTDNRPTKATTQRAPKEDSTQHLPQEAM